MLFEIFRRNRRVYADPTLGELTYSYPAWSGTVTDNEGDSVHLSVVGDKSSPSISGLEQTKAVLTNLAQFQSAAESFLKAQDLGEWSNPTNGTLEFDGISVSSEPKSFRLCFGLSKWPDASIAVLFRDGTPTQAEAND
jgi:hypothetical protein